LLKPNHGDVSLEELIFFEDGLFHYGDLDDSKYKTADETLRRIFIPLASNDERYLSVIKKNALSIEKIIEKADDSIIAFKNALQSNCPSVFGDMDLKEFSEKLTEKVNSLKPLELGSENSNKEEVNK
jgi:hypothetical protein